MTYEIYEGNMERLEKKINAIYNKCRKYGCDFHFAQIGETYKEVEDERGRKRTARFIIVEAEGTAIINDWEFVAAVEHTEKGNIFSGVQGIEIPEKYYTGEPVCEHCRSNRYRKYTYIVRNKETGEFKQVGKSCLKDFTHGMSAEAVSHYISLFDTLIQGYAPKPGVRIEHYLLKDEYLAYVAETIKHFGYTKAHEEKQSTASKALDYYKAVRGQEDTRTYIEYLQEEMKRVSFNPKSEATIKLVKDALAWISEQRESSTYIHNLKTVCSLEYVSYKDFGLLASLFPTYNRAMEQAAQYAQSNDETGSQYMGNVGDKITVKIHSVKCMTSWDGQYGVAYLYKIIDTDGNTLIWKTGKVISEESKGMLLTGTVKAHNEFRGIKQTELTRCQIINADS